MNPSESNQPQQPTSAPSVDTPQTEHHLQTESAPQTLLPQVESPQAGPTSKVTTTSSKDFKRMRFMGITLLMIATLSLITYLAPMMLGETGDMTMLAAAIIYSLLGIGILKHKKIAYHLFNVVAILSILASIIVIPGVLFSILLISQILSEFSPLDIVSSLLPVITPVAILLFFIYGGIVLHPKRIRQIFR